MSKHPFILSWTTKPYRCPQEPCSDQSKEARIGLAGGSWQQVWGWDVLGPRPSMPLQIWVSPLPEAISNPCNFPGAW